MSGELGSRGAVGRMARMGAPEARAVSRTAFDLLRALRRAVAFDEHTQRLWKEAIARGYSDTWVARRLAELFARE